MSNVHKMIILISYLAFSSQFKFVSEITNFSPFKKPSTSLGVPGLRGQLKGCLGLNKAASLPYQPKSRDQKGNFHT